MELVGSSASDSGLVLADLGTRLNAKKNCLDTVYSHGALYKKMKKTIASNMVDLSAGPLSLGDIGGVGVNKVGSITSSVSKLSDVKNMVNMVAKETSYVKSGENNDMDETIPRKTHTRTYILGNLPKQSSFNCMSDDDSEQVLLSHVVLGSNKLPPLESCAPKKQSFNSSKFFALDIELLAVPGKTISDKLICVKKFFYHVDGFGEAFTPSKFPGIIRSSFILEFSLKKTKELAISKKILVNNEIKKVNSHLDRKVIIKKIPVDLLKSAVESVFSKFGKIVSIKIQLIGLDQHRALLYTLPVGTIAYNLSGLLDSYDGKTCFIGHNLNFYICNRCAVVCFADKAFKLAAIVGRNSSIHGKQVVTNQDQVCLAGIYKKKQAPIVCSVSFGGKTWAQVAGGFFSRVVLSVSFSANPSLVTGTSIFAFVPLSDHGLYSHLASLECSLEFLADQVFGILKKLGSIELVLPVVTSVVFSPMVLVSVVVNDTTTGLSSSSSKVLTTKVSGLKFKMMALKVSVESILDKLDHLCSDLSMSASSAS
ncbi:hypothetical protein G9A89_018548 [Geosiphon pyriformis]|nr:hypothetical protein G9A89_018548 [Geosiphon pyriformis]